MVAKEEKSMLIPLSTKNKSITGGSKWSTYLNSFSSLVKLT